MKRVHWLYACAASISLHAAVLLVFKSNIVGDGQPPPGPVTAVDASIESILGSVIEIEQSEAPEQTEVAEPDEPTEQSDFPEPTEVSAVDAPDVAAAVPAAINRAEIAVTSPVATPATEPVLPQLIAAAAGEAQLAMAAPVTRSVEASEIPQVKAKEAEQRTETKRAPPPAASPRRNEKLREAERRSRQRREREQSETDGKDKATARASRMGNSDKEGRAGSKRGGGGTSGASAGAINSYASRVRSKILSRRPSSNVSGGRAVISFGLSQSGSLRYARVSRSSGNPGLDQKALASVRSASPFPPPPPGARSSQLRFSIFFQF